MSSPPVPYSRQADFSDFSTSHPNDQQSGVSLDADFDAIRASLNKTISRLNEIQRDDGPLRNGGVHMDTLDTILRALITGHQPIVNDAAPHGTRAYMQAVTVPDTIDLLFTTGYADDGDGGDAAYKYSATEPEHPGWFQTADDKYWEIVGPIYKVESFGAVGDYNYDTETGTNNLPAFQRAMRTAFTKGGGEVQWGRDGRTYMIQFSSAYPGLVTGSNTTVRNMGSGWLMYDASTLPYVPGLPGNSSGRMSSPAWYTGDPYTFFRTLAAGQTDGMFFNTLDTANVVRNVHLINPQIDCNFSGVLGANLRLSGIDFWWVYDGSVQFPVVKNMPNGGVSLYSGARLRLISPSVFHCGHTCTEPSNRNGISLVGSCIIASPEYSSHAFYVDNAYVEECHDEALQFASIKGLHITSLVAKGCGDRCIEGDTSFVTSHIQGDGLLGAQEIPADIIIGKVIYDGLSSLTGDKSMRGITIGTANQQRVIIGEARIRNLDAAWDGGPSMGIGISNHDNGRVQIGKVTLEDCTFSANGHAIYAQAEYVEIASVELINCDQGASTNSAVIAIADAKRATVGKITSTEGDFATGISVNGSKAAELISISNVNIASVKQCISFGTTAKQNRILIHDCDFTGVNANSDADAAFFAINHNSFTAGEIIIRDNTARLLGAAWYPITNGGGTTIADGCIDRLVIEDNDFDTDLFTAPFGLRSFVSPAKATILIDQRNRVLGQRTRTGSAVPTSGNWGRGDTVVNTAPSASNPSLWRCVTGGTLGTLGGSPTGTTNGVAASITMSSMAGIGVGTTLDITGDGVARRVIGIAGLVATLDGVPAAVTGAAVAYKAAVFKALNLAA